jgi:uncharacterized membrane protein
MTQVSLVGYAVSGAFLGLAYFDLFYVLVVIVVVLHDTVREVVSEQVSPSAQTPASPQGASRTPAVRLAGQEP